SKQESEYSKEDQHDNEEVDCIYSNEDDEKKYDDKIINLEITDDEETEVKFVQDDEKTEEVKNDAKKAELPPTSSSLSVSLGFVDQFRKLSSDTSLIGIVKDTIDAKINSLLDIKIQSEVLHVQSSSILTVPVLVISEPSVLTPLKETPSVALVTSLPPPSVSTIPPVPLQKNKPIPTPPIKTKALTITTVVPEFDALSAVQLRVAILEKVVSKLKKINHSTEALTTLRSHVPTIVDKYLGTNLVMFYKRNNINTRGSEHDDANEHIEKVLEIVDLFHIPKEPDESLFRTWERFKELLMKYPQHYLTDMQEVILFYNGLDVPTRQILDSKGAIPSKSVDDAKIAI
nr:hypothetical protein [Tanacetum cinerariifolium]